MEDPLVKEMPQKRPVILYIIIGILLIIIIVLSILLALQLGDKTSKENNGNKEQEKEKEIINPVKEDHLIPINESYYIDGPEDGAYSYHGCGNHLDSEYYKILDVYNMEPTKNRAILTHFKTYQQTSEFSSPCSLVIMILTYYNMSTPSERSCSKNDFGYNTEEMKGSYDRTEVFNKTTIPIFAEKLKNYGLEVEKNGDYTPETMPFNDEKSFSKWIKKNINEGNILIVLYNDWAGQYAAVIGVDDMGTTEDTNDDVIILADAYDTTDHLQDGYTIWGLDRFFHLWQYSYISFYKNDDSLNHGQWILVKKPKS
mgnify:FL=1